MPTIKRLFISESLSVHTLTALKDHRVVNDNNNDDDDNKWSK